MSAICVAEGEDAERLVRVMSSRMCHRGPDGEGYHSDGNISLGHRRTIIQTSPDITRPLSNEDGSIWITFDGILYNRGELQRNLEKKHNFMTDSCAETVIHAYEEKGFDCLKSFRGDFAFSLWDSPKRLLFSARDIMGLKPLYYYLGKQNRNQGY